MASGKSENTKYDEEYIPFETKSRRSDFLSVSGNTISSVDSDFISVCGNAISTLNTKYDEECIPFGTKSTRSDFLSVSGNTISSVDSDFISVSGNTISTLDSDFLSLCDGNSSTRTLDRTTPSQLSVESTETLNNDQETELARSNSPNDGRTSQDDPEVGSDFLSTIYNASMQLDEDVLVHAQQMCSHCISDTQRLKATHLCKSCPPDCRYICHMCLQSHNFNHAVVSLSGVDRSQLKKDNKAEITGLKPLSNEDSDMEDNAYELQAVTRIESSDPNAETFKEDEENEEIHRQQSSIENQQEMGILKSTHGTEVKTPGSKSVRSRFCKDSLYIDITKDTRYANPSLLSTACLKEYGTYSVKEHSDTKRCIITGICELESGKVVLVDAENCSLKVLKADTFEMVSSHKVEGNPTFICLIEREKVAVAFVEPVIKIVIIAKDIYITNSFDLKRSCAGLTYGKPNLYLCLPDRLESYNEDGEQGYSLRLASTRIDTTFENLYKITINKDEDTLYIVDKVGGIVVTDTSGHVLRIISENINEPDAICIDASGYLFVTEIRSVRVLEIRAVDGKVELVLEEVSKDTYPISLCHGKISNRLIVGVRCSDNIHVFTC